MDKHKFHTHHEAHVKPVAGSLADLEKHACGLQRRINEKKASIAEVTAKLEEQPHPPETAQDGRLVHALIGELIREHEAVRVLIKEHMQAEEAFLRDQRTLLGHLREQQQHLAR